MFTLVVCLVIIIFKAEANDPATGPLEITFDINQFQTPTKLKYIYCDNKKSRDYTVREGEEFKIITKYEHISDINDLICFGDYHHSTTFYKYKRDGLSNVATFKVDKTMGTIWNCTVLTHRDSPTMLPVVQYKDANYSAAYCFMKIHVRQTTSPQTILVNNMALHANRTDLSEKDVDFTAEYQYADGDVVNVTCANLGDHAILSMEYAMAEKLSDQSVMKELISTKTIGFIVKFHSVHNNSYMMCTHMVPNDYSKVLVTFVMRSEFNPYRLKMELPPNGTVMELYSFGKKKFIFYDFYDSEILHLKCGRLFLPTRPSLSAVVHPTYLQIDDSVKCKINGCAVSKIFHLTRKNDNTKISCYIKAGENTSESMAKDKVLTEIRVILRERVMLSPLTTTDIAADPASSQSCTNTLGYCLSAVGGTVFLLLVILLYWSVSKRYCCIRSSSQELPPVPPPRPDPSTVFYLNLLSVFRPINEREAAELENHYEEIE